MNDEKQQESTCSNEEESQQKEYNNFKKQKQNAKYNHFICEKDGKEILLIGVPKDIEEDEVPILASSPIIEYPSEYWEAYFKLNQANRQAIDAALQQMKMDAEKKTKIKFNPYYWDVVADYLFARFGITLYDIARDMEGNTTWQETASRKQTFDRLDKIRKGKGHPREETLRTTREVCAYYLMTDNILREGTGTLYSIAPEKHSEDVAKRINERYTMKGIRRLWDEDGGRDLKSIIMELTGLKEDDINEMPVQIASIRDKMADETAMSHLLIFMEELHKRQ